VPMTTTTTLHSSCLDTNAHNVEELLVTYKPSPSLPTSLLSLLAVVGYRQTFTQHDLLIELSWFLTVTFLLPWLDLYTFDYIVLYNSQLNLWAFASPFMTSFGIYEYLTSLLNHYLIQDNFEPSACLLTWQMPPLRQQQQPLNLRTCLHVCRAIWQQSLSL